MKKSKWSKWCRLFAGLLLGILIAESLPAEAVLTAHAEDLNGLAVNAEGVWAYYVNGEVDTEYTGLVNNESGKWYVKNGYLDWEFTDLFCAADGWYYVMDGRVPTEYTGLVRNSEGLWYVENGKINWEHTGLVNSAEGWYYVLNGRVTEEYTGLVRNEEGMWYVAAGILDWNHTALVSSEEGWFYVMDGRVTEEYTGLVSNEEGMWYIDSGKLNWDHCGLVSSEQGWFYVQNGRVPEEYVGLVANEAGNWYVQNGTISFAYQGLVSSESGWWYVNESQVATNYTGLATNEAGTWYVKDGYLDFGFSGEVTLDGKVYVITGGAVIAEASEEKKVTVTSPENMTFEFFFDEEGRVIEQWYYDEEGTLLGKNEIMYYGSDYAGGQASLIDCKDASGTSIGSISYDYHGAGSLSSRVVENVHTSVTMYYAENVTLNEEGNASCSFGSLEPNTYIAYRYDENGTIESHEQYRYDSNGNELESITYNADGTVKYRTVNTYYENGQLKRSEFYGGELPEVIYEYDEAGSMTLRMPYFYDSTGALEYYLELRYENEQLVLSKHYDTNGNIVEHNEMTYHAGGQLKTQVLYTSDGQLNESYEYDEAGKVVHHIKCTYDEATGKLASCDEKAYENGQMILSKLSDGEGNVIYWEAAEYYDSGVCKKQISYTSDGEFSYVAEYDENGVMLQQENYNYDSSTGELITKNVETYTEGVRSAYITYNAEGIVLNKSTYYPDGKVKEQVSCYNDGRVYLIVRYNAEGTRLYSRSFSYEEDGVCLGSDECTYNDEGLLLSQVWYNGDGSVEEHTEYEYYDTGVLKNYSIYYGEGTDYPKKIEEYSEDEVMTYKAEHCYIVLHGYDESYIKYNYADGTSKSIRYYYSPSTGEYKEEVYNYAAGVLINYTSYNPDGTKAMYEEYDEDRNVIYSETYELNCKVVYSFKNGTEVYMTYDGEGNVLEHNEITYYDDGSKKQEKSFYKDTDIIISCTDYNEAGEKTYVKTSQIDNDVIEFFFETWYDAAGKTTKFVNSDGEGTIIDHTLYEYHDNGKLKSKCRYYGEGTEYPADAEEYTEDGVQTYEASYSYMELSGTERCYISKWDTEGKLTYKKEYLDSPKTYSFHHREYEYENGLCVSCTTYNENGEVSKYEEYNENNEVIFKEEFSYDFETGVLVSRVVYENSLWTIQEEYDEDGNVTSYKEQTYHANGQKKQYTESYKGAGICVIRYDEEGNVIYEKRYVYDSNGECAYISEEVYENGLVISGVIYNVDGSIAGNYYYEYYDDGTCKSSYSYYGEGTEYPSGVMQYSETGVVLYEAIYNFYVDRGDYADEWYIYQYNAEGVLTQKEWYYKIPDSKFVHNITEYENGVEVKVTNYDEDGNIIE